MLPVHYSLIERLRLFMIRAKNISFYDKRHERKALTARSVQFQTERRCYQ